MIIKLLGAVTGGIVGKKVSDITQADTKTKPMIITGGVIGGYSLGSIIETKLKEPKQVTYEDQNISEDLEIPGIQETSAFEDPFIKSQEIPKEKPLNLSEPSVNQNFPEEDLEEIEEDQVEQKEIEEDEESPEERAFREYLYMVDCGSLQSVEEDADADVEELKAQEVAAEAAAAEILQEIEKSDKDVGSLTLYLRSEIDNVPHTSIGLALLKALDEKD